MAILKRIKKLLAATLITAGCLCTIPSYAANPNWYQDNSGHWYYYLNNKDVAKSCWINDSGTWYHFDKTGIMQTGWINDNNKSYYLDSSGAMLTGLQTINGTRYYFNPDGSAAVKTITPNAFLTDDRGAIIENYRVIAGVAVQQPQLFVPSSAYPMENWRGIINSISEVGKRVYDMTNGARRFHVYSDKISYCKLSGSQETELISLEKLSDGSGWKIRISTPLNRNASDSAKGEAYDYQVLRLFCYSISSQADKLDDMIYDSWSGSNSAGLSRDKSVTVGDCTVYYDAENGAGAYKIYAAGTTVNP